MLKSALLLAGKDLRLTLARGTGLVQALLLGLLLVFLLSLSRGTGETVSPQTAAAIFWMATVFCQVLIFSALFALEEDNGQRQGLLLAPAPVQYVWLGKACAGLCLLLAAQTVLFAAAVVFLDQGLSRHWLPALAVLLAADAGIAALGSLLGALSQGQTTRESLLSIVVFPLLVPVLLAGIRLGAPLFSGLPAEDPLSWLGLACAFDGIFIAAALVLFPFVYSAD